MQTNNLSVECEPSKVKNQDGPRNPVHRNRRRKVCAVTDKRPYLNRGAALVHMSFVPGLTVYLCGWCLEFHVGHWRGADLQWMELQFRIREKGARQCKR
jgi:hypothetical protein